MFIITLFNFSLRRFKRSKFKFIELLLFDIKLNFDLNFLCFKKIKMNF